jgi:hypothetical protein
MKNFQGNHYKTKLSSYEFALTITGMGVAKQNFEVITLSWLVRKNAWIPCNGAPTGNRKSSSAQQGKQYVTIRKIVKCE